MSRAGAPPAAAQQWKTSPLQWPCVVPWLLERASCGEKIGGWEDLDSQDLRKGGGGGGVLWERRRSLLCQAFKGGSQGAVSEASALTRRFKKRPLPHYARSPRRLASSTARMPRAHDLRSFTWSSDRPVDACRWRAQQLRGPPTLRFLKRARRGPGSRGLLSVFWIPGYPGPPAPGRRHRPIFSPGDNQRYKSRRRPSRGGAS
jgi:hypothetical protein